MSDLITAETTLSAAIFDALPIPALVHDERMLLASNAAAREIFCASCSADLEGLPITALVHPDGREAGELRRQLLLKHGQRFEGTPVKLVRLTGEPFVATGTGVTFTLGTAPIAIVAACTTASCTGSASGVNVPPPTYPADMPLLDAVLDSFPLPIAAVCDGDVAYANRALTMMMRARHPEELVGHPLSTFMHADSVASVTEQVRLTVENGVALRMSTCKIVALDGSPLVVRGNTARVVHDGKTYGLSVTTHLDS